ncbi:protein-glutamine gamma-glutamyltransferase E-like [Varanus komodoensis]|uniref:protein-glutamine gamma-glutamyltransferase E-like n=1 Tax=Varanus komodoensis TaxID=61221 RepID=UPI001CF7917C|nr:protein-glutamine gamma-glutamyltransferase E-like [Varanus komodoensis]
MASSPSMAWNLGDVATMHHTDQYRGTENVFRRGQEFNISLKYPGGAPPATYLTFAVATGSTSELQEMTRVEFGVSSSHLPYSWSAVQTSATATELDISIQSPVDAIIGVYQLSVRNSFLCPFQHIGTFVLLFNPWLPADEVFLDDDAQRDEYVKSDFGLIFKGVVDNIQALPWNYGQFQEDILNICLSMLDQSIHYRYNPSSDVRQRKDPKYIARVLSATVNDATDGKGVLQGNWTGDYAGGKDPNYWSGSAEILRTWRDSGFQPVKYGQCWVFAGLMTTVLRCLGIPSCPVTNFESGHDRNRDLILDLYLDSCGTYLPAESPDSLWNFHVWTGTWFTRTDLPPGYGGSQTVDGTPQEKSEGIFQCGPASLTAIKAGDVQLNYDGPFVFAEVDADIRYSIYDAGTVTPVAADITRVGQAISTKTVGRNDRQDITDSFKYPAGSPEERAAYANARSKLPPPMRAAQEQKEKPTVISGEFRVEGPLEVGKDVSLSLVLKNVASAAKCMTVNMAAWTILYTGKPVHEIWKDSHQETLGPSQQKPFPFKISYAAYRRYLTSDKMIAVTALCKVDDGSFAVVERVVILSNPHVTTKVLGPAKVGKEVKVEVKFASPLEEELKDCVLHAEGADLVAETLRLQVAPLKAKESSPVQFTIVPSRSGTKHLLINFSCDKYKNIKAFETITVED